MSYDRSDLAIVMTCSQAYWFWALTDAEGEHITDGRRPNFADAAEDARKAFDHAMKESAS